MLPPAALGRLVAMGGSRALAAGLGLVATIVIARGLPPAGLGLWSMALAVQGLALHLGEAGLRSIVTVEVAARPEAGRALLRRYLALRLAISTGVIAAAVAGARLLGIADWPYLALLLTSLWPIALQLDWLPLAHGRTGQAGLLLLVRPVVFVLLLLALPLGGDADRLALLFLAAWWVAAAATWPWLGLAPRAALRGAVPGRRRLLRLALPVAAATVASQLLLSLDLLLVGARFGPASAAQYYLASAILVAGLVVANGLGQAALARLAAVTGAGFRAALEADLRLVGAIAALAAVTVLGVVPHLLPLAFGAAYAPAAGLLVWLLPWFILQHATAVLQAGMTAARLGDRQFWAALWMVGSLVPGLALAWWGGDLRLFALARGLAELVRVVALWRGLPPGLRPFDRAPSPCPEN
ncbi:MAG: oligosaccharide flippase family protein [Geminicoccaceae bacterium]